MLNSILLLLFRGENPIYARFVDFLCVKIRKTKGSWFVWWSRKFIFKFSTWNQVVLLFSLNELTSLAELNKTGNICISIRFSRLLLLLLLLRGIARVLSVVVILYIAALGGVSSLRLPKKFHLRLLLAIISLALFEHRGHLIFAAQRFIHNSGV